MCVRERERERERERADFKTGTLIVFLIYPKIKLSTINLRFLTDWRETAESSFGAAQSWNDVIGTLVLSGNTGAVH